MVALVNDENGVLRCQLAGNGLPVVQCAEQSVQDDNRVSLAKRFIIEFQTSIELDRIRICMRLTVCLVRNSQPCHAF